MKLVVGLGNPGRKYQRTRHNVGFEVVAELARKYGITNQKVRFHGELVEASIDGLRALLLLPQTYMNNSGKSVRAAVDFFQLEFQDLIIVCDDFHLPMGKIRFRAQGSSGGQKGLDDILRQLATENISRLRIGVGPLPEQWDAADYVLSKFNRQEQEIIGEIIGHAATGVVHWSHHGISDCMNEYNSK